MFTLLQQKKLNLSSRVAGAYKEVANYQDLLLCKMYAKIEVGFLNIPVFGGRAMRDSLNQVELREKADI